MLHDVVDDPGGLSEDELLAAHADQLATVIETVGIEAVARDVSASASTLAAVVDGDLDIAGDLDIHEAAAILALAEGAPAAPDIVAEARETLLFAMSTGVLSVDVVAGELALDIEPREVQGMLEGRHRMTLREYVALERVIEGRSR